MFDSQEHVIFKRFPFQKSSVSLKETEPGQTELNASKSKQVEDPKEKVSYKRETWRIE